MLTETIWFLRLQCLLQEISLHFLVQDSAKFPITFLSLILYTILLKSHSSTLQSLQCITAPCSLQYSYTHPPLHDHCIHSHAVHAHCSVPIHTDHSMITAVFPTTPCSLQYSYIHPLSMLITVFQYTSTIPWSLHYFYTPPCSLRYSYTHPPLHDHCTISIHTHHSFFSRQ